MIYTIVPIEQVLSGMENTHVNKTEQAEYMGENVILSQGSDGAYQVDRLLSTNPRSFLKSEFYPGTKAEINKINLNNV